MKLEVANAVGQSLNHPKIINALKSYLDDRIERLRIQLETTDDDRLVHQLQGSIRELKKMYTIREDALAVLKTEKK